MAVRVPSEQEIWHDAMEILLDQLSPAKAIRVLSALQMGHGDYMREREEMFGHLSAGELVKQVRRHERRKPKK
jgi:hypothetical protein